ncbi:MAG: hypothetical protein ACM3XO_08005 [Bacteroidota bacterium]
MSLVFVSLGIASAYSIKGFAAPAYAPPGPDRFSVSTVDYTKYYWWLIYFGETDHECEIEIDHEGMPTPGDIYVDCGARLYQKWIKNQPCLEADVNRCVGKLYLQLMNSEPAQKQVSTILPPPTVQVTLENCNPVYSSSTSICDSDPILVLTGVEPLPGYQITSIQGLYENQPFTCDAVCRLKLPETGENIFNLQFWAYSSYGDSSVPFNAQVRVATTSAGDPDRSYWYVDVLSDQWFGVPVASCVQTWGTLPPIGGPPGWLSTPPNVEELNTDLPYNYLAAQLIKKGAVDASSCPNGGLEPDETASQCGMEVARGAVTSWQNQFNEVILNVAKDTGVPAHLLKNMFAIESQFWPGASNKTDIGLGQLTPEGADTTLMWNPPFFYQFCPLVMDSAECSKGYLKMTDKQQSYLRLALFDAVNANCENCPLGIDLDRANFSIGVFAHTLLANCEQAAQLVENVTGGAAGKAATYEDLWKFTMVNYNAGPGCLGDALDVAAGEEAGLTWDNVASHLVPTCPGAVNYVNQISK